MDDICQPSGTKPDNSEWAKIDLPGLYKMVDGKMIDVPRSDYSDKIPKNGDYLFFVTRYSDTYITY